MLNEYQKSLYENLKLIPDNLKASRLAFHSLLMRKSSKNNTLYSDRIRMDAVAAHLVDCMQIYPDFFFRDVRDYLRESLLSQLKTFSQNFYLSRSEVEDFFEAASRFDEKKITALLMKGASVTRLT